MNKLDQELKKLDKLLDGDPGFTDVLGQYKMVLEAFRDYATKFEEDFRPVDPDAVLRRRANDANLIRSMLMDNPSSADPEEPMTSFEALMKKMGEILVESCKKNWSEEDPKEEEEEEFVGVSLYEYVNQVELLVNKGYDVEDSIKIIEAWKHHED